jgi:tetratricopeptide (TPR) repeat protein
MPKQKRMKTKGLFLLLFFALAMSLPALRKKQAYSSHFKGTLAWKKEAYDKAERYFAQAFQGVPDNFNFALSYAISLSKSQKLPEALAILENSLFLIPPGTPEYAFQQAVWTFSAGLIHSFGQQYDRGSPLIRQAAGYFAQLGAAEYESQCYYMLAYNQLMNQGLGGYDKGGIDLHLHVGRADIEKSFQYLDTALRTHPANKQAWRHYNILADTLQYTQKISELELFQAKNRKDPSFSYGKLPANALRALSFTAYDELLLLLDISGSMVMEKVLCMGENRFKVMKATALTTIDLLPDSIWVGLGTIGGDCGDPPKVWQPVQPLHKKDLKWTIESLPPHGTTPLLERLQQSPALFSRNPQTKKSILLISDGANVCSAGNLDICSWVEQLRQLDITLNVITFLEASIFNTTEFAEYSCLADITGGQILYLDDLRCSYEYHEFNLLLGAAPELPKLEKMYCMGSHIQTLWGIFPGS